MPKGKIVGPTVEPNPSRIRFCFEYLQTNDTKFPLTVCTTEFYEALLRELGRYAKWTIEQFTDPDQEDRRHFIEFPETSEKGFPFMPATGQEDGTPWSDSPWQFGLPGKRGERSWGWRVHGFVNGNVFHIVWLDPEHLLDKKENR